MLIIEQTHNEETIKRIITHPSLWPHVSEYGQEEFYPVCLDGVLDYWLCSEDDVCYGLYRIDMITSQSREIHTALLPNARGRTAKDLRAMIEQILIAHYKCRTLITKIPSTNRLAVKYAREGGMTEMGVLKNSWMCKNREVVDVIFLQKELMPCQPQ